MYVTLALYVFWWCWVFEFVHQQIGCGYIQEHTSGQKKQKKQSWIRDKMAASKSAQWHDFAKKRHVSPPQHFCAAFSINDFSPQTCQIYSINYKGKQVKFTGRHAFPVYLTGHVIVFFRHFQMCCQDGHDFSSPFFILRKPCLQKYLKLILTSWW